MPDTSGARRIFALADELADMHDDTAHDVAFIAASAALRGVDELDATLSRLIAPLVEETGFDQTHVALALTVRQLAMFVRSLTTGVGASRHPLADSLKNHGDLSSLRSEQMIAHLERWLQTGGDRE